VCLLLSILFVLLLGSTLLQIDALVLPLLLLLVFLLLFAFLVLLFLLFFVFVFVVAFLFFDQFLKFLFGSLEFGFLLGLLFFLFLFADETFVFVIDLFFVVFFLDGVVAKFVAVGLVGDVGVEGGVAVHDLTDVDHGPFLGAVLGVLVVAGAGLVDLVLLRVRIRAVHQVVQVSLTRVVHAPVLLRLLLTAVEHRAIGAEVVLTLALTLNLTLTLTLCSV